MRRSLAPVLLCSAALLLASCSADSGGSDPASSPTTTETTSAAPAAADGTRGHACTLERAPAAPKAKAVAGTPSDLDLTSFDGTPIRIHWFPTKTATTDVPAPTILMGPGWSETGDTSTTGSALFDSLSIPGMWKHGYNVLTWDPRGFGKSGGEATVNDPKREGRDVQTIIDWVATKSFAQQDHPGDPRIGMAGFSYGGGIQLTTAAIDCRVDAIVPGIAWRSLETSLYKSETVKAGWSDLLVSSASAANLDPHITSAHDEGSDTGTISAENRAWFISRGPGDLVDAITTPTLILQGTVDNLFTLDEGIANYRSLRSHKVPVGMAWFCGGHGACLTKGGDDPSITTASFAWFDRYLKGDTSVDTGPRFETIDQDGLHWTAKDYPVDTARLVTAKGAGTLDLRADGGSGGVTSAADDLLGGVVAGITPSKATNAVNVTVDPGKVDGLALGAPVLSLTYTGTRAGAPEADAEAPSRVFAQLVDDTTGLVVGNQITPVQVTLDGKQHQTEVPLEVIAHHLTPGHRLVLQLVATSTAYWAPDPGGEITFATVTISIPVAATGAGGVTKR